MDKATFSSRLLEASDLTGDFTVEFASNHIPNSYRYLVSLNQSCDHDLKPEEHVFPHDVDPVAPLTSGEVVDILCRDNRVPEWIDIWVERVDSEHSYMRLVCCGRFTDNEAYLYHKEAGIPPFSIKSPPLPPRWSKEQGRFDLNSRPKYSW